LGRQNVEMSTHPGIVSRLFSPNVISITPSSQPAAIQSQIAFLASD
jgi:hypothetical protein